MIRPDVEEHCLHNVYEYAKEEKLIFHKTWAGFCKGNPEVFIGIEHFTPIWGSGVSRPFWAIFCFTPIYVRIPLRRSQSEPRLAQENKKMLHKTRFSEYPLILKASDKILSSICLLLVDVLMRS